MTDAVQAVSPTTLRIHGMTCAACQIHVQRALQSVPGVDTATVNLMAHTAQVTSTHPLDPATLITAVKNSGYQATLPTRSMPGMSAPSQLMDMDNPRLGLRTLLALIAGAAAMLLSMPLMMSTTSTDPVLNYLTHALAPIMPSALMSLPAQPIRWVLCALALATMLFLAPEIYTAAFRAARHRSTNMNTLVALGTLAAFAASFAATIAPTYFTLHGLASDVYYEAVVLILAFLLTGRWLEARARARATAALHGFTQLESSTARLLTPPQTRVPQVSPLRPGSDAEPIDYSSLPETLLPLSAIEPNDLIRVLPGDRIPLDGLILHGRSSIDESMLTGEPLPHTRSIGDHVSGGTLNLDGPLVVRATAVGAASTLAQMQRLLDQAQSSRAPMQRLADRASAIFVPTVLALAALTFTAWSIALNTGQHHEGFARPLSIAIAVLIIACPCAMGLAVPAAVTVSLGRAAQSGLLIKGGEALERLATVDTIALDKTGTLTEGRPRIASFQPATTTNPGAPHLDSEIRAEAASNPGAQHLNSEIRAEAATNPGAPHLDSEMWEGATTHSGLDRETLLAYAAAAERLSTHPLAKAVVDYHLQHLALQNEDTIRYPEASASAKIGYPEASASAKIGYPEASASGLISPQREGALAPGVSSPTSQPTFSVDNLITLPGIGLTATIDGHKLSLGNASLIPKPYPLNPLPQATALYLLLDDHLEAIFYATDELRPTAAAAIAQLRALHINPILLTGDIATSATPIAQQAGITDIQSHLLPADKLTAIRLLQQQGHKVAMVGDGINDAAALAQSDAGLAMASGSDLAREAGDILLLHTDLNLIPLAIRLARRTTHIMRQNLGWAVIYNLIGLPLAAGILYPHFHILLSPILASIAMALSSVSVLANSLRLRRL